MTLRLLLQLHLPWPDLLSVLQNLDNSRSLPGISSIWTLRICLGRRARLYRPALYRRAGPPACAAISETFRTCIPTLFIYFCVQMSYSYTSFHERHVLVQYQPHKIRVTTRCF